MGSTATVVAETFFLAVFCIGAFVGNLVLFILVTRTPALQKKGNVFILNLAAADLLVAVVNMPITIVTVISRDWILGEEACYVSGFLTLLTFVASCMALTMISVNRYHAIVHWTTYHDTYTSRRCAIYVALVWAITIGLSLPPFFGWAKFAYDPGQSYCFAEWSESKSYTIFMITACLLGPLCVMSYCYVKIIRFKKASRRRVLVVAQCRESSGSSPTAMPAKGQTTLETTTARSDRKLTRTIMSLIAVFGLCWSPFAIIMVLQVFADVQVPRSVDFASLVLGYLNSFCNVFVYNATNKTIRQGYRKLLGCRTNQVDIGLSSNT